MIFMGVINLTLQIASGYLVILVYKLIKFTDLPQLLSVCFIHLSMAGNLLSIPFNLTLCIAFQAYIILFIFSLHLSNDSYINASNIVRVINFIAVFFFSLALLFDLYKW